MQHLREGVVSSDLVGVLVVEEDVAGAAAVERPPTVVTVLR